MRPKPSETTQAKQGDKGKLGTPAQIDKHMDHWRLADMTVVPINKDSGHCLHNLIGNGVALSLFALHNLSFLHESLHGTSMLHMLCGI